jgi:hypothetical protein
MINCLKPSDSHYFTERDRAVLAGHRSLPDWLMNQIVNGMVPFMQHHQDGGSKT